MWSFGDVTGAFLDSAEFRRQGGKLFLRQPSGGLPGLHPQQPLEIQVVPGSFQSPSEHRLEIFCSG